MVINEPTVTSPVWIIDKPSKDRVLKGKRAKRDIIIFDEWSEAVVKNPYHTDIGQVGKLKGRANKGKYKWKKPPFRIVYELNKPTHTIFPIEFNTRGNLGSYK